MVAKVKSLKICSIDRQELCDLIDNSPINATGIIETNETNTITELKFDYPIVNGGKWVEIIPERLVLFNGEYYTIKTPVFNNDEDGKLYVSVTCKHLSDILATDLISIEEQLPMDVVSLMKLALCYDDQDMPTKGWKVGRVTVDRTAMRGLEASEQSPFTILLTIAEKYQGMLHFNSQDMTVDLLELSDTSRPKLDIRDSKNLQSVSIKYDTSDMYTRLYCYGGTDDDDNEIDIMTVNPTGMAYIDNFDYFKQLGFTDDYIKKHPELFVRTTIWRDSNYYDPQDLYDDGVKELEKVAFPTVEVEIDALDISALRGADGNPCDLSVGDCVQIVDDQIGLNTLCNVIKRECNYDEPWKLNVTVTNSITYRDTLSKLFSNVSTVSSLVTSGGHIIGTTDMDTVKQYLNLNYLNVKQLEAKYVDVDTLKANYATIEYLQAHYIDAESIGATYATIGNLQAVEAKIKNLDVDYINGKLGEFEDLFVQNGEFHKLIATDAEINELKANKITVAGKLKADKAELEDLIATKVTVGDFNAYKATIEKVFATYASIEYLETNYLKASQIESNYAKITELDAANANIKTLKTDLATIQELVAKKATIEDLNAANAKIDNLNTDVANINKLMANKVEADYVQAEIAKVNKVIASDLEAIHGVIDNLDTKYATIEQLNAAKANLEDLISKKASIDDLNAAKATIGELDALVANINSVLAGNIGTGLLQTIHLTAENIVIDDAVIKDLIAAKINVSDLKAGNISTDKFTIKSDDGGIQIVGSTQQFTDKNGKVRLQIGRDAKGNFNFIVFGEDGTTAIYDQNGITKQAVPDGLIVDKMVADNANISGSKLDINSVVERINQDGTTTINSNKIWIDEDNQTLGASFKKIQTTITNIEDSKMYRLEIISSNGILFKNNNISTTLSARVWSWDEDVTDQLPEKAFIWTRTSDNKSEDEYWNKEYGIGKKQIVITKDDVDGNATFSCELDL